MPEIKAMCTNKARGFLKLVHCELDCSTGPWEAFWCKRAAHANYIWQFLCKRLLKLKNARLISEAY